MENQFDGHLAGHSAALAAAAVELSREQMYADLAEVLGIPVAELLEETADGDVSLVDLGLDSVRLMTLVERWQAGGRELDYVEFASEPVLESWIAAVESE